LFERADTFDLASAEQIAPDEAPPSAPICHDIEVYDILFGAVVATQTLCSVPAEHESHPEDDDAFQALLPFMCDDGPVVAEPDTDAGDTSGPSDGDTSVGDTSEEAGSNGPSDDGCHGGLAPHGLWLALAGLALLLRRRRALA